MTVLKKSLVVMAILLTNCNVTPGHNSWVVGNEPLFIVDFSSFKGQKVEVAKKSRRKGKW
jgi:hypothetical protein